MRKAERPQSPVDQAESRHEPLDVFSKKPNQSVGAGSKRMSNNEGTKNQAAASAVSPSPKKSSPDSNGLAAPLEEYRLKPEAEAELEQRMVSLGMTKYGLDEPAAREWAHAFCSTDIPETGQR
jgi:hypothetical protein